MITGFIRLRKRIETQLISEISKVDSKFNGTYIEYSDIDLPSNTQYTYYKFKRNISDRSNIAGMVFFNLVSYNIAYASVIGEVGYWNYSNDIRHNFYLITIKGTESSILTTYRDSSDGKFGLRISRSDYSSHTSGNVFIIWNK